jgi:predicted phage terminase large subunit-like protein
MSNLKPNEYLAILRNDFSTFIERSFYQLNPDVRFLPNWHIELIASELERCLQGETKRLIINVPPRSLKSHCASVAFPAWVLGHKPSSQIICASYAQDLADKLALDCRSLMNSDWYGTVFSTRLSQRRAVSEFMTEAQGVRLATSVGGVLTGRGGDFIIIDDPLKPEEALSDSRRNAANDWYQHTLYSRLNDKAAGCIIIIMQRLHEDDLVGRVLPYSDWKVLRFPAIAVEDETHVIRTRYSIRTVRRLAGQALHPERESLETLEDIRRNQSEDNFSAQYQQQPAPPGGCIVKPNWFKPYKESEKPTFDFVFQSWDTAVKAKGSNDFTVGTTWGAKGYEVYLLDVHRQRMEYPELKPVVREKATRFHATIVLVEDKGSGTALIQELRREGLLGLTPYEPKMDKLTRLQSVTPTIANGFVYLPEEAAWLTDYLHELTSFPNGKFNDQCDSTSQALDWFKKGSHFENFRLRLKAQAEQAESDLYGKRVEPHPCPSCQSRETFPDGAEMHCRDCGKRWDRPIGPHRVTRADMLKDRWRF